MASKIHIGTSGYQYDHWKEVFYPEDIPKKEWFGYYQEHFSTVEINNTFYNLPEKDTIDDWREAASDDFLFSVKYSQYGTHMKKLKDPEEHIKNFLEPVKHLEYKLGPVLVQLPPDWNCNKERLEEFLEAAPKEQKFAVEIRDESWLADEIYELLEEYNAALVIHDMIEYHPRKVTADWVYLRFHGDDYSGSYSEEELDDIAKQIREHAKEGREVFAYFNNDDKGYAAKNAKTLKEKLDL